MTDIAQASNRIADITGVIDGIAFQGNILALNAAVETARAGDQGHGFAVVAAEVRQLSQRSATAAREVKALIGDSVAKVAAGSQQVAAAGASMEDIIVQARRVSQLIDDISNAAGQQTTGISQVGEAVNHLDYVTQPNDAQVGSRK
jgi:methyl-accepting chemotaxis protein